MDVRKKFHVRNWLTSHASWPFALFSTRNAKFSLVSMKPRSFRFVEIRVIKSLSIMPLDCAFSTSDRRLPTCAIVLWEFFTNFLIFCKWFSNGNAEIRFKEDWKYRTCIRDKLCTLYTAYSTNHVYLHRPNAFGFWQTCLHLCYETLKRVSNFSELA